MAEAAERGAAPRGASADSARLPSRPGTRNRSYSPHVTPGRISPWRIGGVLDLAAEVKWEELFEPGSAKQGQKAAGPRSSPPSSSERSTYRRPIPPHSQLFAASVGNVDWLRSCLHPPRKEIVADHKGFTAIHFAAQQGKLPCIQVLIEEYKFPVDLTTKSGQTPLHLVIHRDNRHEILPCVDYLLKKGANVNARTNNGTTPLHLAARDGLLACVKVLVQSGADVHAQSSTGYKPIDYCKVWSHRACARFLKDAMWKQNKREFSREMGKLKKLKEKLVLLERYYLTKTQKEQQILRKADFRKWLSRKLLDKRCPPSPQPRQDAGARPRSSVVSTALGPRVAKHFHPSVEARLQSLLPVAPSFKYDYTRPTMRRPPLWNPSNNPTTPPITDISHPQSIRVGVHPDPSKEHNFCCFLEVVPTLSGGVQLLTVDGRWVKPVPQLPFDVMVGMLYPGTQWQRMQVPQGFYPLSVLNLTHKGHPGSAGGDTAAMSLRQTFDRPFLEALRAHQAPAALSLPAVPT